MTNIGWTDQLARWLRHAWFLHIFQELRGRCLDHEHHDMREHREMAHAAMHQAIPGLVADIASGRAEENSTMLPQAHPAMIGLRHPVWTPTA